MDLSAVVGFLSQFRDLAVPLFHVAFMVVFAIGGTVSVARHHQAQQIDGTRILSTDMAYRLIDDGLELQRVRVFGWRRLRLSQRAFQRDGRPPVPVTGYRLTHLRTGNTHRTIFAAVLTDGRREVLFSQYGSIRASFDGFVQAMVARQLLKPRPTQPGSRRDIPKALSALRAN